MQYTSALIKLTLILTLTLSACSYNTYPTAETLAATKHWIAVDITTSQFTLRSYQPADKEKSDLLTIYIEGDGFAWSSRTKPSSDPTPKNPVALKLALAAHENNSLYLARPCQYIPTQAHCDNSYWTSARYAEEVIQAMSQAIDKAVQNAEAKHINLIGFSGGGTVATLIALRRNDINKVITLSANLDHTEWSNYHHVSPLADSLNPAHYIKQLSLIEQHHFVGANDKNTPPILLQKFHDKFRYLKHKVSIYIIDGATHSCCWEKQWVERLEAVKTTTH